MSTPPFFDLALERRIIGLQLAERYRDSADKRFIVTDQGVWTFGQTQALVSALARGLRARGVGPGDRVVLMLPNCAEFVFAWFGVAHVGAVTIPIDPRLTGTLLEYMLSDATPQCLVIAEDLLPALAGVSAPLLARIATVVVVPNGAAGANGSADGYVSWPSMLLDGDAFEQPWPVKYEDTSMVMYTSGSSGRPKGVIMSSAQTFSSGIVMVRGVALNAQDILFAPLPLFHGMSSRIGVLPALLLGIPIVIGARFSASGYWREAAEWGATVGLVVPTMPKLLLAQNEGEYDRRHRIRAVFNAKPEVEFPQRFGAEVIESYGVTEISHVISAAYHERRIGSCGKVQPNNEVRLVDEDGKDVAPGEPGEIIVRSKVPALMMRGYLNQPDATAEAMRDGWFHTADYAYVDADGYYYFSGRKAERIRRLGENISALDIEAMVATHAQVMENAAMAYPAPMGEDDIRLVVVMRPGVALTALELHDWLKSRLPRYMQPRYIEFADRLPRTESGKLAKRVMMDAGLGAKVWDAGHVR